LKHPIIHPQPQNGDILHFEFEISEDLEWFSGHFPGSPVLPGVVQLRWAVELAQEHFKMGDGPLEVLRLKFKSVVVPPTFINLELSKISDTEATFEYTGTNAVYSQGKLRFAGSPP
jgi:3-hydroxymyristoyl/3-hydroxydecanoyl-(acyl carrier protein) dehydratase